MLDCSLDLSVTIKICTTIQGGSLRGSHHIDPIYTKPILWPLPFPYPPLSQEVWPLLPPDRLMPAEGTMNCRMQSLGGEIRIL